MRPFYIIRFLYGLAEGELAKDYIDYTDMVTNWDTNIAPTPPTLLDYNNAETQLTNMETAKNTTIDYYSADVSRIIGANGIGYGFDISDALELILSKNILDVFTTEYGTLSQAQDERVLELLTIKQKVTISNISILDVPTLTAPDITTLLDDYNISEYIELLKNGWYYLVTVLGVSDTDAKAILIEAHNTQFSDTISAFYLTNNIDSILENIVVATSFWAYNFQPNVVFDDVETQMQLVSAKTFAAVSYIASSMGLISGGGFVAPQDGVYQFEIEAVIEEDDIVWEGRKVYVELDINGTKHLVSDDHYLITLGDIIKIKTSETIPLDNADNVKVFLHGSSGAGEYLNCISGSLTITRLK